MDLLAVQGTLKSLLQNHSSKVSILLCSAFFMVQLSHPYMTNAKTIALTRQTFVGKFFKDRIVIVIQSLSRFQLFVTSWTKARQASLSFTISQCLLKLLSIESVPCIRWPNIGVSASTSVLPMNIQD